MTLKTLIQDLDDIARLNHDEFRYYISLENGRAEFVAEETADNHPFFSKFMDFKTDVADIEAGDYEDELKSSCETWDYDIPESLDE